MRPLRTSLIDLVQRLRGDAGLGQDVGGLGRLLHGQRLQQPLDGDEAVAGLLGQFLGGREHLGQRLRQIELAIAAFDLRQRLERRLDAELDVAGRPPARSISDAAKPSSSSTRTLRICSGVNCWWLRESAMVCADWMKPRTRSEYFSRFISVSFHHRPALRHRIRLR